RERGVFLGAGSGGNGEKGQNRRECGASLRLFMHRRYRLSKTIISLCSAEVGFARYFFAVPSKWTRAGTKDRIACEKRDSPAGAAQKGTQRLGVPRRAGLGPRISFVQFSPNKSQTMLDKRTIIRVLLIVLSADA